MANQRVLSSSLNHAPKVDLFFGSFVRSGVLLVEYTLGLLDYWGY